MIQILSVQTISSSGFVSHTEPITKIFDNNLEPNHKTYCFEVHYRLDQFFYFVCCFLQSENYQNLVKQNLETLFESKFGDKYVHLIINCSIKDWDLSKITYVDTKWSNRIQYLAILRMELEESLSWLSTLGGAYSSLGDRNINFARQAELISLQQMRLSLIYGDPNLTARCLIYLSHSWSQQGKRRRAIKLIKNCLYPFLVQMNNKCDLIVKRMYQALCFRVRFIYKFMNFNNG